MRLDPGPGMVLPDYRRGIVNLVSSIAVGLGGAAGACAPLAALPPEQVAQARHVVLLVLDGLGHHWLQGRDGALRRHLQGPLSSVFPSTTASAIPSFMTGQAPAEHGLTGWNMYFRELGMQAAVLPFRSRIGKQPLHAAGLSPQGLLGLSPVFDRLARACHVFGPQQIVYSDFNLAASGRAVRHGYASLAELFEGMARVLRAAEAPSYIHAYYPELDSLAHAHGVDSPQVQAAFAALDAGFAHFIEAARGTDTLVLATADHGMIDTAHDELVDLDTHPELRAMLAQPLSGEARVAYAQVRCGAQAGFEAYVHERLAGRALAFRSADLVRAGWFGPGPVHAGLADRIGDYTLVMQGRAVVRDWLPGEERYIHVGVHGGLSEAEMTVPLIVVAV